MASNRNFTQEDFIVAAIGGFGLLLMIVGGLLLGFGTVETSSAELFALSGLLLLILATVLWLFWRRPWERFDDLQTAYYTGHHHDEHADEAATPVAEAVVKAPPAAQPEEVEAVAKTETVKPTETPEPKPPKTAKESAKPKAPAAEKTPSATAVEPQDLTKIEGLGKKTQQALYNEGVNSYAQIAALSPDELEEIVKVKQGVRIVGGATQTWPKQAQFLADGDEDGLKAYQDTLVGGREVK